MPPVSQGSSPRRASRKQHPPDPLGQIDAAEQVPAFESEAWRVYEVIGRCVRAGNDFRGCLESIKGQNGNRFSEDGQPVPTGSRSRCVENSCPPRDRRVDSGGIRSLAPGGVLEVWPSAAQWRTDRGGRRSAERCSEHARPDRHAAACGHSRLSIHAAGQHQWKRDGGDFNLLCPSAPARRAWTQASRSAGTPGRGLRGTGASGARVDYRTTLLEALLEKAPLGVCLVDSSFSIRHANPAAVQIFGEAPHLTGRNFEELMRTVWNREYADAILHKCRRTLHSDGQGSTPEERANLKRRGRATGT